MRAWKLYNIGDIRCEETERPVPGRGEALVRVRAAGICGSDIPRIYRDGAHRMPLVPGHEFSGEVAETGGGMAEGWEGKRVAVFPLIPCRSCIACRQGQYEMCRHYSYLGSRQDGGFAEDVIVPAANLVELPADVSYEQAAMAEPVAVAAHALLGMGPAQESTVVVYGLGTVGLLLVMLLKDYGIENLLVVGNKDFQRETVLALGVGEDCYCDSRGVDAANWVANHTKKGGADIVFECVGREETIAAAICAAAPSGRVCMVGNPQSDIILPRDVYWKILRNQLTVTGTWNSSFAFGSERMQSIAEEAERSDWMYVMELLGKGKIHPENLITHRLPLSGLERGLHVMRDKTEPYIKVMIKA